MTSQPTGQSRLDAMKAFVDRNPDEAFPRYGLAMEYAKLRSFEEALGQFEELKRRHPDYLALYYQYGMLLAQVDRGDEARQSFEDGIRVAIAAGNAHAQSELQAALQDLQA